MLVPFKQLMADAERRNYAVGYFESWNLESLLAVADAAEATGSPVILGFSGIYLPHPNRVVSDPLSAYAAMGRAVCQRLSVPACLLFNESPNFDWVMEAIKQQFQLVMFSDDALTFERQTELIRQICERAHGADAAVEAEMQALPGVAGRLSEWQRNPDDQDQYTNAESALEFVEGTGIDALAVNIGQVHLHGRQTVSLRFDVLERIQETVSVPLVLHGASSVEIEDLNRATQSGIHKVNVGSVLKQVWFDAMRRAAIPVTQEANPYEILGSGFDCDVLTVGRIAMQRKVEQLMACFGSAGKA